MFITVNEETYEDGQVIFEEGSYGDWIYVIDSGSVELSKTVNKIKIVLEVLHAGDIFGELGFITKHPRTATARAVGTSIIGVVDKDFLDSEYNKLSSGFRTILNTIISRLNKVTQISAQTKSEKTGKSAPVVLSLTYNTTEELIKAFSENTSKYGLFIKTKKPMATDERFYLKLKFPGVQKPITVECQVAWSRTSADSPLNPPGMGVEFIKMSKAGQEILNKELKKAEPLRKK